MVSADAPYERYEPTVVVDDFGVLGLVDTQFGGDAEEFEVIHVPGYEDLECYAVREEVEDERESSGEMVAELHMKKK